MLLALKKMSDTKYLCPYCGKLLERDNWDTVIDHVVPNNAWKGFRLTRRYAEHMSGILGDYPCPEGSPKNLIYSCRSCNRSKSDLFIVPNWERRGMFKLWGIHDLHTHSIFFYSWSDVFMEHYNRQKYLYAKDSFHWQRNDAVVQEIARFRAEFERRQIENDWSFS